MIASDLSQSAQPTEPEMQAWHRLWSLIFQRIRESTEVCGEIKAAESAKKADA